ncbi:hypothetical protein [Candidatus Berkiella aquae]|uniref:Uncharacterized protein n=1 Tax=Candidatus Berkiella aquae TaxID=295108 RepID=A0A0Q9YDU4_9GAMM|nr:hypothetical protein [Candidatus Berkiella aquae]MCS5709934.1 hypothetical protein [Candidatus Berkiella aquae]
MGILQTLGKFIQDSLQTNVAKEVSDDISDIYYNFKRPRAIWCLGSTVFVGAGCAALFVAESTTYGYFGPIVLQALPFLGTVGTKIAVGTIGAWAGGSVGHNGAKFVAQEFYSRRYDVSNSAYVYTDEDINRIIANNPHYYPPTKDLEQGGGDLSAEEKAQHVAELKNLLNFLRDNIVDHKDEESTAHDSYKLAFLSALRTSNLDPAMELWAANNAKREMRKQLSVVKAKYLSDRGAQFVSDGQVRREEIDDEDESESHDLGGMRSVSISMHAQPSTTLPVPPLKDGITGFKHMQRQAKGLTDGKFYPLDKDSANKGRETLTNNKNAQLLVNLKAVYQTQAQRQKVEEQVLPSRLRELLR